ncbi:MAG: sugar phosphate isomerase/epimerase family protein [Bryobacteraceae bacterium]
MKIGVNTLLWTAAFDRPNLPLIGELKGRGFDAIEIARFDWAGVAAALAPEIRREAEAQGIGVIACSAFTSSECCFATGSAAARQAGTEFLERAIDATAAMGANLLVGPFHGPVGYLAGRRRNAAEWSHMVDSLRAAGDYAHAAGVRIAIEPLNRFETYVMNTAADAARLCDEVAHPAIGILYDTFHANIEEKSQGEGLTAAGGHLFHVHTCENDRGAPGSGHVEWEEVVARLKAMNYDGYLVIESFGFAIKEIAAAACIWRDLAPTPETIAWDGLKFLRGATSY